MPAERRPRLVVYTRVYPNRAQPGLGLFVRERMRRVAEHLDLEVVAPVPWFPFQGLLGRLRPHSRPADVPYVEEQDGIRVHHPRFFCIPGLFKWTDGFFQALGSLPLMRRLQRSFDFDVIDAHFVYPDGVAARWLGRWLNRPYTITLRGSLTRFKGKGAERRQIERAMSEAAHVFSVADALRQDAIAWGQAPDHVQVVGNGVDLQRFYPEDRAESRECLGLPARGQLLVSVGGLTERKGFHRVIAVLPDLLRRHPDLHFAIAGGASPEGNNEAELRRQTTDLGLGERVHFLGQVPPEELRHVYSAGDLFVLATRFEGWANVFLEASACGLPIVTTRVGGNAEVVPSERVGLLVPYGDAAALREAIDQALSRDWDREAILAHAQANAWQTRIPQLVTAFQAVHDGKAPATVPTPSSGKS
ncbi:glycosyltransferase [Alkalilimnicola ehrlichii MLHE-1]|uniref:Glycosyl transferase, group 1 n=1 Tax=Alkalilimnicola ehrlichii (strain ATCC BAA-1101 / DSM 17681 / MLHE-1) TaxID=187272 RepID=Q0ACE6_ALKEH|nr:glycosyltransferase [Alkalilimnicola ehrlichii]ABI55491.1 glycosyl transferase, group 1 [Alkalilimnicola ehrlichii MLHE-1]